MSFLSRSILLSLFMLLASHVVAKERTVNTGNQSVWVADSSNPAVKVSIKDRYLYAHFLDDTQFPALRLKRFNSNLLNEYAKQFVKFQDYNNDGYTDIAILKSTDFGGSNLCYSVFSFLPNAYTYDVQKLKTVCESTL